jgi:hypothetical protein
MIKLQNTKILAILAFNGDYFSLRNVWVFSDIVAIFVFSIVELNPNGYF